MRALLQRAGRIEQLARESVGIRARGELGQDGELVAVIGHVQ